MKVKFAFPLVVAGSLALAACGTDGTDEAATEDPAATETTAEVEDTSTADDTSGTSGNTGNADQPATQGSDGTGQDQMRQQMQSLDYTEFELEVEYGDNQEYEAQLERKDDDSVTADYEDDLNSLKKQGLEAFNDIYPLVEQLNITSATNQDEAIQEVISAFSLPEDYTKFSLELRFSDGTEQEFEVEK